VEGTTTELVSLFIVIPKANDGNIRRHALLSWYLLYTVLLLSLDRRSDAMQLVVAVDVAGETHFSDTRQVDGADADTCRLPTDCQHGSRLLDLCNKAKGIFLLSYHWHNSWRGIIMAIPYSTS
jgi:hypothetical protein